MRALGGVPNKETAGRRIKFAYLLKAGDTSMNKWSMIRTISL
jgi:hypothetical protein